MNPYHQLDPKSVFKPVIRLTEDEKTKFREEWESVHTGPVVRPVVRVYPLWVRIVGSTIIALGWPVFAAYTIHKCRQDPETNHWSFMWKLWVMVFAGLLGWSLFWALVWTVLE